eukprot:jgi/Orpsp1_1/1183780/evm.model.c7180000086695.1
MKVLSSYIFLAILSITTVLSRPTSIVKGVLKYRLNDNGTAALIDITKENVEAITIPATIEYNKKQYRVSEIAANTFTGKDVSNITFDENISGLVVKKNAFYEMRLNRAIYVYSKYITAEIDGFRGLSNYANFQGVGVPNLVDDYSEKLLKKWNLPVRKNYKYVSQDERMHELFTLGKRVQENFGNYDNISGPDNAANVMFIGCGGSNGISRVYRLLAITMGIPYDEVLVGSDNIHISWNYVKINKGKGLKWYVFDIVNYEIGKNTLWNLSAFITDAEQVKKLQKFYGPYYTISADKFIIYTNRYNYPNESRYPVSMEQELFNDWLKRNNAGVRA